MPLDGAEPEGRYANLFHVGYNAAEFLIDFGQYFSGESGEQLHTRIITHPSYARALLAVLAESIVKYERTFGAIEAPQ
jgi:Protein of unknown function (DUF3467)